MKIPSKSCYLWCCVSILTVTCFLVTNAIDLVIYNTSTQPKCKEVERKAVYGKECGWYAGLYRDVDQFYLKGRIAAYKIQWFNGGWSGWFVPGVNDIDIKFNIQGADCKDFKILPNTMRRWWSYFYDHTHKYVICKDS
ncbi:uncharacterized protein LOC134257734 [Saccostrea cucullata]|uniref:uncharacterized protein LOC134257734 n=1 Tax=Saccostrea cuccullata TaxID=36930 RepID=UPI002ED061F8